MVFLKTQPENMSYVGTCERSLQNPTVAVENLWVLKRDLLTHRE